MNRKEQLKEQIVEMVRHTMYSTSDMLTQAYALGELLADLDDLPAEPERNRIIKGARLLRDGYQQTNAVKQQCSSDAIISDEVIYQEARCVPSDRA